METFAIRYNPQNVVITKLIEAIKLLNSVEVLHADEECTIEDLVEIEEARKSGLAKAFEDLEKGRIYHSVRKSKV